MRSASSHDGSRHQHLRRLRLLAGRITRTTVSAPPQADRRSDLADGDRRLHLQFQQAARHLRQGAGGVALLRPRLRRCWLRINRRTMTFILPSRAAADRLSNPIGPQDPTGAHAISGKRQHSGSGPTCRPSITASAALVSVSPAGSAQGAGAPAASSLGIAHRSRTAGPPGDAAFGNGQGLHGGIAQEIASPAAAARPCGRQRHRRW